jgi:hypothetical protein
MILQITLGYYLNTINKSGSNSIDDLSFRFEEIINEKTKKNSRLSVTSISSALNLPRETVNRKIDSLIKKKLLAMNNNKSIILGTDFQKIFELFALETTHDLGKLITRWNNKDYLDRLIGLVKYIPYSSNRLVLHDGKVLLYSASTLTFFIKAVLIPLSSHF